MAANVRATSPAFPIPVVTIFPRHALIVSLATSNEDVNSIAAMAEASALMISSRADDVRAVRFGSPAAFWLAHSVRRNRSNVGDGQILDRSG